MGKTITNQEALTKAIDTSDFSAWGILNDGQAKEFYTNVVNESLFLKFARTIYMKERAMEVDRLNIGARVAKPWVEATAPGTGDYVGITTSKMMLTTSKIIVPWEISYDTLEDNIEGDKFESTMMSLISEAFANDLEELAIDGDTASGDAYLALQDGIMKRITGVSHVVDYSSNQKLDRTVFSDLIKALPTKYKRNRKNLIFLCGANAEQDYRDELAGRNTGLGDASLTGNDNIKVFKIEVVPVPFFNDKDVILTLKKNFIVGIYRNIRVETDKDIMKETHLFKISTRTGFQLEEPDAVAYTDSLYTA